MVVYTTTQFYYMYDTDRRGMVMAQRCSKEDVSLVQRATYHGNTEAVPAHSGNDIYRPSI